MRKIPIVLLHGWQLNSDKYSLLRKLLIKEGYKIYIPDLPGFGRRKFLNKSLKIDDYVMFLSLYLRKKRINKCFLIGHSFGGRIAIVFASRQPNKIKKLFLTGTPGLIPVNKIKIISFLLISKIGKLILSLTPFFFLKQVLRKILYRLAGSSDYMHVEGVMKETFKNIIREDLVKYMKKIKVPTLLIWGSDDKTVPVTIAQKMSGIIKTSKLIEISCTNHRLPYQNPNRFWEAIKPHLL